MLKLGGLAVMQRLTAAHQRSPRLLSTPHQPPACLQAVRDALDAPIGAEPPLPR